MKWMLASCALLIASTVACAHPVAQGAIEMTIGTDRIVLRARLSLEEIFVANMYAKPPVTSPAEVYRRHADYFVGSSRVDLQACKLEYSIVSPK